VDLKHKYFCGECDRKFYSPVLECLWCGSPAILDISLRESSSSGGSDEEANANDEVEEYEYFCSECEAEVAESSDFCHSCGAYIGDADLVTDDEVEQARANWGKGWGWFREHPLMGTAAIYLAVFYVVCFVAHYLVRGSDRWLTLGPISYGLVWSFFASILVPWIGESVPERRKREWKKWAARIESDRNHPNPTGDDIYFISIGVLAAVGGGLLFGLTGGFIQ
jgi:DNA-directed RNA polymerase subunit RPC12/RpoP